jgi:hypothetical protein
MIPPLPLLLCVLAAPGERVVVAPVTAYRDRGIMANRKRVHPGAIAAPRWVPLGTICVIAGKRYVVSDRVNKRYPTRWDIWRGGWSKKACLKWGKRTMVVKVLKQRRAR